jgi:zinc protease
MALHAFGGFETHGVALDALAADWERAVDWAAELIREPSFPEDRRAWLARQAATELDSLADQPEVKTAWGFLRQLYHPHRRALPLHGSREGLLALAGADCAAFHLSRLGRGLLVTAAGDLDEEAVTRRIGERFGGIEGGGAEAPQAEAEPPAPFGLPGPDGRRLEVRLAAAPAGGDDEGPPQAHLYAGHLTVPRRHPDYEALELTAVVLGAGTGLTGRIPERLREHEGLAYSAHAQTVAGAGLDPGRLVAYVATSVATVEPAERGIREEIARLVEGGITDGELADARSYLLGREPFERETARQWADLLAEAEHYGLPLDDPGWRRARLEALDRAAVEAAARRHLRPDDLRVTVGVPAG